MTMLEDEYLTFERGGDMLVWYINNVMDREPADPLAIPKGDKDVADEILTLDKDILNDIR